MNPLSKLIEHGQSYWLDNLTRRKIRSGELERRVREEGLRGITSNPAIFNKAISGSEDYTDQIASLAREGRSVFEIYEALVLQDIREACDVLRPVYDASEGTDGFVSLELTPDLAHDSEGSKRDARRLFEAVDRPNVLIKIPGTPAGLPAIEEMLYEGVNVNITLLFSIEAYDAVARAYVRALQRRRAEGSPVDGVASVASFFLSRIDVLVDQLLGHRIVPSRTSGPGPRPEHLLGKAGLANAKLAYQRFLEITGSDEWAELAAAGAHPQKVLWASTSTKDPLYGDVRYVEPLIGPHTINTMPDETIEAFADHGTVTTTVTDGLDEARRVMEGLDAAGIDFDSVTDQLLDEGVEKFVRPFDTLMATLAEERQRVLGHGNAMRIGVPGGDRSTGVLDALQARRFVTRLHARDPWLWTDDPDKAGEIADRLGWLDAPEIFLEKVEELETFAREVRDDGFTRVVLLGMGGSSLSADVARRTFPTGAPWPEPVVLDDTHPEAVEEVRWRSELEKTLFVVSSKSGTTSETIGLYRFFLAETADRVGEEEASRRFVAVTDPGSPLAEEAGEKGFRRVFLNPPDIGGRYSALSWFGLVPMALQGVNVSGLLRDAVRMKRSSGPYVPAASSPGVRLGALLADLHERGRDKITFVADDALDAFGAWAEQLLAESTGKDGKGLVPVDGEPLGPPGVYDDDRVFVRLRLGATNGDPLEERLSALEAAGHPVIRIRVAEPVGLGAEFLRWEVATATAGAVMGLDPFDQPDVEDSKRRTRELLEKFQADGVLPEPEPGSTAERIALVWEPDGAWRPQAPEDPRAVLDAFLDTVRPGDYLALLFYGHRTVARRGALERLRTSLRDRLRVATTLGWGPRYLHSTGQLHKGGADNGVFLLITTDAEPEPKIPGHAHGFGTLNRAQALGDYRALVERGRRVLRVHLKGDSDEALRNLSHALDATTTAAGAGR